MGSMGESFFSDLNEWKPLFRQLEVPGVPDESHNLERLKEVTRSHQYHFKVLFLVLSAVLVTVTLTLFYSNGFYDFRLKPLSAWELKGLSDEEKIRESILEKIAGEAFISVAEFQERKRLNLQGNIAASSLVDSEYSLFSFYWVVAKICFYFGVVFLCLFELVGKTSLFRCDRDEIYYRLVKCYEHRKQSLLIGGVVLCHFLLGRCFRSFMTLSPDQSFFFSIILSAGILFEVSCKLLTVDFKQVKGIVSPVHNPHLKSFPLYFFKHKSVKEHLQSLRPRVFPQHKRPDLVDSSNTFYLKWSLQRNVSFTLLLMTIGLLLTRVSNLPLLKNLFSRHFFFVSFSEVWDSALLRELVTVSVFNLTLFDWALAGVRWVLREGSDCYIFEPRCCSFILKLLLEISKTKSFEEGRSDLQY